METYYDFNTVLERVPGHIESIIKELFPEARHETGAYRIGSVTGEKGRSLVISTRPNNAGCYFDHSDPDTKGNIFSLVAHNKGTSYQEAGIWLAKFLGVPASERFRTKKRKKPPEIDRKGMAALKEGKKAVDFAASRGISLKTLGAYKVACNDTHLCMPHFDHEGNLVLLKHWPLDGSKEVFTNREPVHCLFGKHTVDPKVSGGYVIITEGQWDAMSWHEAGFAAVSIPSGASNHAWIEEDWVWLSQFTEIFLDFDNDEEGRIAEQTVKGRLGLERVRSIRYEAKDANEVVKLHGWDAAKDLFRKAFQDARDKSIEHIVDMDALKNDVREHLARSREVRGTPFFLPSLPIEFRLHESTIWYGYTSHGKSTALECQIAWQAKLGIKTFVASFESATKAIIASILIQFTGDPAIAASHDFDEAYEKLKEHVIFYDSQRRADPKQLVATMTLAHKQLGVESFVVDNVMTLETDRQDNTAQAAVSDDFRVFVVRYPVHLHLAAHPKKPQEAGKIRPPALSDIRGASEWGDMAFNAICVFRDVDKAERVSAMYDERMPAAEIEAYRNSTPDGKFLVRKQRWNGFLPQSGFMFRADVKRYYRGPEDLLPYFTPKAVEDLGYELENYVIADEHTSTDPAPAADADPDGEPF